jgi:hypothetical protein
MFDPFDKVNSVYGAPMGRASDDLRGVPLITRLYVRHQGGGEGYDKGGAYWGLPSNVYAVWTRGGELCAYFRAHSKEEAVRKARAS